MLGLVLTSAATRVCAKVDWRLTAVSRSSDLALLRRAVKGGESISLVRMVRGKLTTIVKVRDVSADYVLDDFIIETPKFIYVGVREPQEWFTPYVYDNSRKRLLACDLDGLVWKFVPACLGVSLVGTYERVNVPNKSGLAVMTGSQLISGPLPPGIGGVDNLGKGMLIYAGRSGAIARKLPSLAKGQWNLHLEILKSPNSLQLSSLMPPSTSGESDTAQPRHKPGHE